MRNTQSTHTSSVFIGAAFLMATSAIGPGFLTQTTVFTTKLLASFGFAILISIVVDIIVQVNIWRIIVVIKKPAQDIGNELYAGLGSFLALLLIVGGMVFNIGNIAGCGLGLNVLFGIDVKIGAMLSALIAVFIFSVQDATKVMDWFTKILGFVMIVLMLYICISSYPPLTEALYKSFLPDIIDFQVIITIVGGTVGGYITFSGAHRLLEAGIYGKDKLPQVQRSAIIAIGVASLMRILLFLASLGVVMKGLKVDMANPPASVFQLAAGTIGYKLFGIIIWAAAVTSVVGVSFTSISFIQSFHPKIMKYKNSFIIFFIIIATLFFVFFGRPIKVLIFAGAFNGLILAFSLGIMLIAATQKRIMKDYKHPKTYLIAGFFVVLLILIFGSVTVYREIFY